MIEYPMVMVYLWSNLIYQSPGTKKHQSLQLMFF
ncbi:hypothetical protein CPS_0378 [Colwellia psychrerythraea 34H]|uniref:Uncharacterized protein n=1 Tax=Colwellia psychrerythraea (strain 34H / ATCC BAA-681) TaxID=167879 RepID=Q489X8_COLP3|nr:hypothetical protein CPS_0378 [Colwellia psychrerythraea 34H]